VFLSGKQGWACFAGWVLLVAMLMGTALAAVPISDDPAQLLTRADGIKTSDHAEFIQLMKRLGG
jgi:hypothetical protein